MQTLSVDNHEDDEDDDDFDEDDEDDHHEDRMIRVKILLEEAGQWCRP